MWLFLYSFPNVVTGSVTNPFFSLVTPGHLLSLKFFLIYHHVIEYMLHVQFTSNPYRQTLLSLWNSSLSIKWGPLYRLCQVAFSFGFIIEDPIIFIIQNQIYSIDPPLSQLKHLIRDPIDNVSYLTLPNDDKIVRD